ncbi:MAG: hypothetical protein AAFS10_09120, partial [Myxococcota bacterium]
SSPEECDTFCRPTTVSALDACFGDDGPIDQVECVDVCMDEGLADADTCVQRAGTDCDAIGACLDAVAVGDDAVSFQVVGTDAIMNGVIDARTVITVETLLADHPEVTRIVLEDCPGSANDEANLRAARLIRQAELATHVPSNGVIASGAVDFFLAGTTRTADVAGGARLGVHSWGGDGIEGADVPRNDPAHQLYLDYYAEMGIPADFYWFTLEAASADEFTLSRHLRCCGR